jgi:hypothetical protein
MAEIKLPIENTKLYGLRSYSKLSPKGYIYTRVYIKEKQRDKAAELSKPNVTPPRVLETFELLIQNIKEL